MIFSRHDICLKGSSWTSVITCTSLRCSLCFKRLNLTLITWQKPKHAEKWNGREAGDGNCDLGWVTCCGSYQMTTSPYLYTWEPIWTGWKTGTLTHSRHSLFWLSCGTTLSSLWFDCLIMIMMIIWRITLFGDMLVHPTRLPRLVCLYHSHYNKLRNNERKSVISYGKTVVYRSYQPYKMTHYRDWY